MPSRKTSIIIGIFVVLVLGDVLNYFWANWGLITIHAQDKPIGEVIRSIERQGWVRIYSNVDPMQKISMVCDHVPLPDAMETLAANVDDGSGNGRGGAQWHLGFFVAPTSADVKAEIRSFTDDSASNDDKLQIYNFPSMLNLVQDESSSVPDPRRQVWPGFKLPPPPPAPDPNAAAGADPAAPAPEPETQPTSVQGYLRAFARQADVWIMAPSGWDPPVAAAPPPSDSIISAVDHFVGNAHGSVTQAIILRARPPRVAGEQRRGPRGGGFDLSMMEDRVDNAINGLPKEEQPAARAKLAAEVQFQKEMSHLPPDARRQQMMAHFRDRMMDGDRGWRRSPEKRAKMYARMVSNRMAATGK